MQDLIKEYADFLHELKLDRAFLLENNNREQMTECQQMWYDIMLEFYEGRIRFYTSAIAEMQAS